MLTIVLGVVSGSACEDEPEPLTVYAAASLGDVLPRVAEAWQREGGAEVRFSFDATSRLARQLVAGAPADLFLSADRRWMDYLSERTRIVASTRVDLLENRLVVVVPADAETGPERPADLLDPTLGRIGIAGEGVPAGRYADAALATLDLAEPLHPRLVRGSNVRTVLAWVAAGEVDAGFVYETDARAEPRTRTAFVLPAEAHPPIVYPAAVVRHARNTRLATRFLSFCHGEAARTIFEEAGFTVSAADAPKAGPRAGAPEGDRP